MTASELLITPIDTMRAPVNAGHTRSLAWRLEQLDRLQALLDAASQPLLEALRLDLGKPPVEASYELIGIRQELKHARRHLRRWLRPASVALPIWAWPGSATLRPEPLGCVLIIGPWNYPFLLCLIPLVSALAAGNTAVLKPSEHTPHTSALIRRLVQEHFPSETVQVVEGDGSVAAQLLQEHFDHIFFTGGARVGRLVLAAAAPQLTPVTLELGGKSPAIVLDDADIPTTANRLAWGKSLNAGQTCIAPDHLLVTPAQRQPLVDAIAAAWQRFHGDDPLVSADLASIVNAAQFERLESLLAGARQRGQVLVGGRSDPARRRIEPTLLAVDDPDGDPLMQEELFGPLLPVIMVANLEQALERVRRGSKPLTMYLFGGDRRARQQLLDQTSSGSVSFNDVVLQGGLPQLAFGGVGESGMGNYHGEAGFRTFSHHRSVLNRSFWLDVPLRYPPYAGKLGLIQRLLG
ncbi:MAG: aldehyde dehydrogenase family protein [Cyanobacteria bacterium]|nr:aldehyde dehydrogenase family protein [Cyanobacteriota bacterium]